MNYFKIIFITLISISIHQKSLSSPWTAVNDSQLRNDVEILAQYGIIKGPINTWPMSWKQITRHISQTNDMNLPNYVDRAILRIKNKIPNEFALKLDIKATNVPDLIRGFDNNARNDLDVTSAIEYNSSSETTIHLEGGYRNGNGENYGHLDGSYISQDINNWSLYAGTIDRWWGPGRQNTLLLSNNARPMISAGFRRIEPRAFSSKWLNWIGPWQWDLFIARQEKERFIPHAIIAGMRFSMQPTDSLEIGLSRALQLCGENRPCNLETWGRALIAGGGLDNNRGEITEPGNQLASVDITYTGKLNKNTNFRLYANGTGEDETVFLPYKFATQLGISLFGPFGNQGASWRFTTEYSNTISHEILFFGTKEYNTIYNHNIYRTGYRYKNKAIGHSLDSDSKLISLSAQYYDLDDWEYSFTYHYAKINEDGAGENFISSDVIETHIIGARVSAGIGFGKVSLDIKYYSDAIPYLQKSGSFISSGIGWKFNY